MEPELGPPLCPIFVSSAASIKLLLMARVATDKIGLTIAEDADKVCVTGKCSELGLLDLDEAAEAATLALRP